MNEKNNDACRYEVVERYCPRCEENVIMRKIFGNKPALKCMNYDKCTEIKDGFCKESSVT